MRTNECIRVVCGYIIVVKSLACLHLSVNNKYFSPALCSFHKKSHAHIYAMQIFCLKRRIFVQNNVINNIYFSLQLWTKISCPWCGEGKFRYQNWLQLKILFKFKWLTICIAARPLPFVKRQTVKVLRVKFRSEGRNRKFHFDIVNSTLTILIRIIVILWGQPLALK